MGSSRGAGRRVQGAAAPLPPPPPSAAHALLGRGYNDVCACVQSFVSCTLGVKHVGYNILAYGLSGVASTLLAHHAEQRRVTREALVGVAAVLQLGLLVFLFVWIPDQNLVGVFVAVSVLSGTCDGFWITQCTCKLHAYYAAAPNRRGY